MTPPDCTSLSYAVRSDIYTGDAMNKNILQEIVENITGLADELRIKPVKNEIEYGQLIGYAEALSIIKTACTGYDLNEIHLDYDIDKKYL